MLKVHECKDFMRPREEINGRNAEEIRAKHEGKPDRRRPAPNHEAIHAAPVSFCASSQHQDAVIVGASLIYKAWHSGRGKVQVRVTFPRTGRRQRVKKVVPGTRWHLLESSFFSKMLSKM